MGSEGLGAYKKAESLGFSHHEKEVSEHKRLGGGSTMGRAETGKQWKSEATRGKEGQISAGLDQMGKEWSPKRLPCEQ